jgi:hypothetical protein
MYQSGASTIVKDASLEEAMAVNAKMADVAVNVDLPLTKTMKDPIYLRRTFLILPAEVCRTMLEM